MTLRGGWCWVRTRGFVVATAVAIATSGCGGGPEGEPAPAAQESHSPPSVSPTPAPAPSYEVHEWGFIEASPGDTSVRVVSGPHGLSALPPPLHGPGLGAQRVGATGKPVLYFHLDEGVSELALSVAVRPAGEGQLLEHFPPGELSADQRTLRWPSVRITRGACRGSYPALAEPRCQVSDGLCELAELPGYESAGADCVNVGAQRTGVLFYRSGPAQATLPLGVTRPREGVVTVDQRDEAGMPRVTGWVMRIDRGEDRSRTRVRVVPLTEDPRVWLRPATSSGASGAQEGIDHLRAAVLAGGLDEQEADAFMAAWTDALFGTEPQPPLTPQPVGAGGRPARGNPRSHPLGSVSDAIVYLLPQDSVDALVPLELTPTPRAVRRVFLARVTLAEEPTTLELERPVVRGSFSRAVVDRVLHRHSPGIRQCVLDNVPAGRITLQLRVLPTGVVEPLSVDGLDIGDRARACILAYGRLIRFPAASRATAIAQPMTISH